MSEPAGPVAVETVEHLVIPTADGTRLAARLWRPADALDHPVPVLLEYIPYRKRDGTRGRDEPMHAFFAAHGYAVLRVDLRGSGESEGLLEDEYLPREQEDALDVIAWAAAQPWSTGAVGMMGKSWGGFNALQVAARRPPALKAIITVCSTDDRFADDIHYMGGCLLNDNLWWGAIMLAYQSRPPDPELVGEGWRQTWLDRLAAMPFWPRLWLDHQSRDAYWRQGSVCEDFSAIACPVFAVGGWADAYTNAVPRLLAGLDVPRLGLIGPWAHIYPQDGAPGPAIDFLGEALRWWDHWLKDRDTGIMHEPMLRAYVEDWEPPATSRAEAPGRFVGEREWPSRAILDHILHLGPGTLCDTAPEQHRLAIRSPLWTGAGCGEWMGTGVAGELPADQRLDDGQSLCFDGAPLTAPLEILGMPIAMLDLSADRPHGQIAVRLCDVAPDGSSRRITYAVLNLDHRDGPERPRALRPGETVRIRLPLKMCGYRVPAGHRLRLALSTAYWPLVWPARDAATISIETGRSALVLPLRGGVETEAPVTLAAPRRGPAAPQTVLSPSRMERHTSLDLVQDVATYVTRGEGGLFGEGVVRFDAIGTALRHDLTRTLTISGSDPLSARAVIEQRYDIGRDGWAIRIETSTALSATSTDFRIEGRLRAYENERLMASRDWDETVPRRHV